MRLVIMHLLKGDRVTLQLLEDVGTGFADRNHAPNESAPPPFGVRDLVANADSGIISFRASGADRRGIARMSGTEVPTRRQELLVFLFFTVVLAPLLSVAIVGGYGFAIWMYQLIAGPPGS